jgi:hypothetical protein
MNHAPIAQAAAAQAIEPLSVKDRIIIGLILFFAVVAFTFEAYWLIFNQVMESRTDFFARIYALYWPADYTYRIPGYPIEKAFTLALERVNTLVTPFLSFFLIWAIIKRKPYRYPLQLAIANYTFYGTFLYYYVAHISGHAMFAYQGTYPYVTFYLASLPWIAAYGWMNWDAYRAIVRRYKSGANAAAHAIAAENTPYKADF